MNYLLKLSFVFLLLSILGSSCMSKKKHLEALQSVRNTNENVVNDWQKRYNTKRQELNIADEKIRTLELDLAERKGENNILVGLRNELQLQIQSMESQMSNLGSSSKSVEQTLRSDLIKKKGEIQGLQQTLASVNTVLNKNQDLLHQISGDISFEIETLGIIAVEVGMKNNQVIVTLPEAYMFKSGSTSRMTENGKVLLEKMSDVFSRYPQIVFRVVGHTDNTPANVKRYKDNWNFSALQAATIVRSFIEEYDVNTSQLSAGAKGEFEPRASNSSPDGKRLNRRIEIEIFRPYEDLVKEVKQVTGGF